MKPNRRHRANALLAKARYNSDIVKGELLSVCGDSCAMVEDTYVGKCFKIDGDRSVHSGPYPECGNIPYSAEDVWK